MIDCAIDQACLPGKSDKRNIYPPSSSSKPPVMDEHGAECKINLPNTTISGLESWMKPVFFFVCFFLRLISCVILSTTMQTKKKMKKKKNGTRLKSLPVHQKRPNLGRFFFFFFLSSVRTKAPPLLVRTFDALSKEKLQGTDFSHGLSPSFFCFFFSLFSFSWSLSTKSSKSQRRAIHLRAKVPRWKMNRSEVACQAAVTPLSSTGLWTC